DGPRRALDALRDSGARDESRFGRLAVPLAFLLLGREPDAVNAARKIRKDPAAVPWSPQGWYHRYLDYHCGQISGDQLLQIAGTCRPKLSEAHFAIGLRHLCDGDRVAARAHFRKCVEARVFIFWDHIWGRAFLKRLEENPTWPPWILSKPRADNGD